MDRLPIELVIKILEWLSELELEIVAQCNGQMQIAVRTVLMDRYRRLGLDPASALSIRELVDLTRPPDYQTPTTRHWNNRNGQRERSGAPAVIWYYENGQKQYEYWYRDGSLHRDDGPAPIGYYENGQKGYELWKRGGSPHRDDGPAQTSYYDNGQKCYEEWYREGKRYSAIQYPLSG